MKSLRFIPFVLAAAQACAVAASGDFTNARLDLAPGNETINLSFSPPLPVRALRDVKSWQVTSRNRKKEEAVESIAFLRVKGFPTDAKGQTDTNLPPEQLFYSQVQIGIKRHFQHGWSYQARFHPREGVASIGAITGLEASGKPDLVSDWISAPQGEADTGNRWQVVDSLHGPSLTLDIRNAGGGSGANLGIDYDFRLFSYDPLRFRMGENGIGGAGVRAGSKGYLKSESSTKLDPKLDSVISSFDGYADLLFASESRLATFLTPQLGFKNEANQSFKTSTYTLGAGTSFDLGFLFPVNREQHPSLLQQLNVLDLAATKRPIEAPRFYIGFDRVFNANSSNRSTMTGDSAAEFNRLTYEAAWGLPVLNERSYLTATWDGYHDLDATKHDFHSLVEIKLTYAITDPKADNKAPVNLLVKYINGSLPPNFGTESTIAGGVSISFK